MSLTAELRQVLRKHIEKDHYLPKELKPLAEEIVLPIINHIAIILGTFELSNRRTLAHPEMWDEIGKPKYNKALHQTPKAGLKCTCHPHDILYYGCRCK